MQHHTQTLHQAQVSQRNRNVNFPHGRLSDRACPSSCTNSFPFLLLLHVILALVPATFLRWRQALERLLLAAEERETGLDTGPATGTSLCKSEVASGKAEHGFTITAQHCTKGRQQDTRDVQLSF